MSEGTQHAKHRRASTAGSIQPTGARHALFGLACLCVLGLVAFLGSGASSALADTPPTVTIDTPTAVTFNSAHLSGSVNPQGGPSSTAFRFQYTTTPAEEESWRLFSFGEFSEAQAEETSPIPVEADLGGIAAGTEYFVRLLITNEEGANSVVSEVKSFTTEAVNSPSATSLAVSAVTADSAHFDGTVNSGGTGPGEEISTYRFQCEPECSGLAGDQLIEPNDGADHAVEADATGLQPNTSYQVKLIATNSSGSIEDEDTFTTDPVAPEASTLSITGPVAGTSARIVGQVDPRNSQVTDCHFDYGTTTAYGQSAPCDSDPGAGNGPQIVAANLTGLQVGITYHYRFVAQSAAGATPGLDQTLTTASPSPQGSCPNEAIRLQQDATHLPDCRAYEMVSPADKNGLQVNVALDVSPDGNRALFGMFGGAPQSTSGAVSWLRATRTASGWVSENVLPPASEQPDEQYQLIAATPDLASTLWSVATGLGQQGLTQRLTLARLSGGSQSILQQFQGFFGNSGAEFVGSDDFAHVFGLVPVSIDPSHQPATWNVYDFGSGAPELLSVMPGTNQAPSCGVEPDTGFAKSGAEARAAQNWASADGSRIFFVTSGDNCADPLQLYVRDRDTETTTLISAPLASGIDRGIDLFLQAAADGSWVIYRSASALDPADTDASPDIYRYGAAGGNECLTCVASGPANVSTKVENLPSLAAAVSEDGSHVYFISKEEIDGEGVPGDLNLYLWHAGAIHYIAPSDGVTAIPTGGGDITPDGESMLFRSSKTALNAITGSDNGGFFQLYRYDDDQGEVTCVSCPSGAAATADIPPLVRSSLTIIETRHVISDDGSIVAFPTRDALVPGDINQTRDIYEWHDGEVSLLTSGTMVYGLAETRSDLVSVSSSGRDILIEDYDKLTREPQDGFTKLFDARVGGGFPSPPAPPGPCSGEACHGSPATQSGALAAGSDAFAGAANAKAKHARKRHHKSRRHKSRHHDRSRANNHRRAGR